MVGLSDVMPPLTISPRVGTVLGGTPVEVSGPSFSETDIIVCSFDGDKSLGIYISNEVAICVTPAFESIGWVTLYVTVQLEEGGITVYSGQDCFYSGMA